MNGLQLIGYIKQRFWELPVMMVDRPIATTSEDVMPVHSTLAISSPRWVDFDNFKAQRLQLAGATHR